MPRAKILVCLVVAGLGSACAGASFPRETHASNARSDDPWLEGERCIAVGQDTSDLRIEDLDAGTGRPVGRGETVRVHYVAALPSGAALHDTRDQGLPSEIIIGSTKTICGFEKALIGMSPGGQRRVYVPWHLAFGESGRAPDVPPRTDLVFVIDLYLPAETGFQPGAPPAAPQVNPNGVQRPAGR
jgi:peptidylprolyl isomerase